MREPIKFHWKATHHLYIGMGVLLYALVILPLISNNTGTTLPFIIGLYIVVDDIVEHSITATTPLRIFAEKLLFPILNQIKQVLTRTSHDLVETESLFETVLLFEGSKNDSSDK
jgi:hypothetical protein